MLDDPEFPLTFTYHTCNFFFSFYTRSDLRVTNKPQVSRKERKRCLFVFTQKEELETSKGRKKS